MVCALSSYKNRRYFTIKGSKIWSQLAEILQSGAVRIEHRTADMASGLAGQICFFGLVGTARAVNRLTTGDEAQQCRSLVPAGRFAPRLLGGLLGREADYSLGLKVLVKAVLARLPSVAAHLVAAERSR